MKILGRTRRKYNEDGFLLEATRDEIVNLLGYRYKPEKIEEITRTGCEIEVHKMFSRLYDMANKATELSGYAERLRAAADFISSALPGLKDVSEKGES